MFSQTAEYALRAIVYLGNHAGKACTTATLAKEIDAPANYLAKVLKGLTIAQVISSQRGINGGFTLTRDPSDITILEVIDAVDTFHRITKCPLGRPAHFNGLCPLHRKMDNVIAVAQKMLETTTIGEVLEEPGLLCTLPCLVQSANNTKVKTT